MQYRLPDSFLNKIDWLGFELFVADLYKDEAEISVVHNVTEVGKSGSKRQVDVLVHRKTKLHELKIIIECKFWKEKISRDIIDVLVSAVNDLKANKGVIFTTQGYDEGSIQYAQSFGIDLFLVRDVREEEWGHPGRVVTYYLQTFGGAFLDFKPNTAELIKVGDGEPHLPEKVDIQVDLLKENEGKRKGTRLYSYRDIEVGEGMDGDMGGVDLSGLLIKIREKILKQWMDASPGLYVPVEGEPEFAFKRKVIVNFNNYPYCFIKYGNCYLRLNGLEFTFLQSLNQVKCEIDRAATSGFILMVENYLTDERHYAYKNDRADDISLQEYKPIEITDPDNVFENDSIIKITTDYFVGVALRPETETKDAPDFTFNLEYGQK